MHPIHLYCVLCSHGSEPRPFPLSGSSLRVLRTCVEPSATRRPRTLSLIASYDPSPSVLGRYSFARALLTCNRRGRTLPTAAGGEPPYRPGRERPSLSRRGIPTPTRLPCGGCSSVYFTAEQLGPLRSRTQQHQLSINRPTCISDSSASYVPRTPCPALVL
jgi:hypothetical protein